MRTQRKMLTLAAVGFEVWRKVASLVKGPATLTAIPSLSAHSVACSVGASDSCACPDSLLYPSGDLSSPRQSLLLPSEATPASSSVSSYTEDGTATTATSATAPTLELPPPPPRVLGTGCPQGLYFQPAGFDDAGNGSFIVHGKVKGAELKLGPVTLYSLLLQAPIPVIRFVNASGTGCGWATVFYGSWCCVMPIEPVTGRLAFHAIRIAGGRVEEVRAGLLRGLDKNEVKQRGFFALATTWLGARFMTADGSVRLAKMEEDGQALCCYCFSGANWDLDWVSRCSTLGTHITFWKHAWPAHQHIFTQLEGEGELRLAKYELTWASGAWRKRVVTGTEAELLLVQRKHRRLAGSVVPAGDAVPRLRVGDSREVMEHPAHRAVASLRSAAWERFLELLKPVLTLNPIPPSVFADLITRGVPRPLVALLRHHADLRASPDLPRVIDLTTCFTDA